MSKIPIFNPVFKDRNGLANRLKQAWFGSSSGIFESVRKEADERWLRVADEAIKLILGYDPNDESTGIAGMWINSPD